MATTPAAIAFDGYNVRSIVAAIERLILLYQPTVSKPYDANYRGIVEALLDLGDILAGRVGYPQAAISSNVGATPPGWSSATGSYTNGKPGDGSFWFDTRQGRLFVADQGEWYQTNGAEAFVHIGNQPPVRQLPGCLWFDTRQGKTFVYLDAVSSGGEAGWYQANGGGAGGGSSALALGNLINVDDDPLTVVPAKDQNGVLLRDGRRTLTDSNAYVVADHIDLGTYGGP